MARTAGAPSHNRFSHFRCEEGVITDVNRKTFTITAESRHTGKRFEDIQVLAPYIHYDNGEGIHHLPEVGAICMIATPSDNTPPFIMGYIGVPSVTKSSDAAPERSTPDAEGSSTDVSFRSRRIDMNPGDIALSTRDENFVIMRRGGVLQLGATPVSQRVYIPVLNYIKDFCENYEFHSFAGDVSWTVSRSESDPSGNAPCTYVFHANEFAQDAKATVRVRHLPVSSPGGGDKAAWEVCVAPQGISRDDGSVSSAVYTLLVTTGGDKAEMIGASRDVTISGDDNLSVSGNRSVSVGGNDTLDASGSISHSATGAHVVEGSAVKLGEKAASSAVKGTELLQLLSAAVWPVATVGGVQVAKPSAAWIAALQNALSKKVLIE